MDGLSRIVRLARLEGRIDVRCMLAGRATLDNAPAGPGEVPFHLVLDGRCSLISGASAVDMAPGDLVLLPHGDAHRVAATSGRRRRRYAEEPGAAFPTRRTVGAEPELDLFCGHYRYGSGAGALLFRSLSPLVHVTLDAPALTLAEVLRGEARADGPGTGAVVTQHPIRPHPEVALLAAGVRVDVDGAGLDLLELWTLASPSGSWPRTRRGHVRSTRQAAVRGEPGQRPLDRPPAWDDSEPALLGRLAHDVQTRARRCRRP